MRYSKTYSRAATIVMAALLWASCNPAKIAMRQVDHAILTQPAIAAAELRKAFPCTILSKIDTVINNHDTTIWVECPGAVHDTLTDVLTDTINHTIVKTNTIRVPVTLPIQVKTVTKYVKDSADNAVYEGRIATLTKDLEKYRGRSEKRGALNLWLIIACAVLLVLNILQWKFKRVEKTANTVINDVRNIAGK